MMYERHTLNQMLPEKTCKKCGKRFLPAPEHRFRVGNKWYCKWTCYLHRNDKEVKMKYDEGRT